MSKALNTDRQDLRAMVSLRCPHATRLISESLDRPLTRRERFGLRMHLLTCRPCARFRAQMRKIQSLFRARFETSDDTSNDAIGMPVGLSQRARDRMKAALSSASN